MRNDYHDRIEKRREAHQRLAEKRKAEASQRFDSPAIRQLRDMQGEPIKVGHHSERRHRKLFEQADNDMRKGCELTAKAKHHAAKAVSVGDAGVSQDDPDALAKLRRHLAEREATQAVYKLINRAVVKLRLSVADDWTGPAGDALRRLCDDETTAEAYLGQLVIYLRHTYPTHPVRIPAYVLSNNNAQMRRLRKRIEQLEALPPAGTEPVRLADSGDNKYPDDCYVETRPDLGRVAFVFAGGPPCDMIRASLKRSGWRWSRREGAWLRHLNANGVGSARLLAKEFEMRWLGEPAAPAAAVETKPAIRFNKHHVTDGETKARCHYSLDNRTDGRPCVTIYAKDYDRGLGRLLPESYVNDTDSMSDYYDHGRAVLFEDHPLYKIARDRVESFRS